VPICPECRAEYREGFSRCADCGVALVSELPPEPEPELEPLEREIVFVSANPALLAIAKSVLESADIDFVVLSEFAQGEFSVLPARIAVDADRSEEAKELLSELEP